MDSIIKPRLMYGLVKKAMANPAINIEIKIATMGFCGLTENIYLTI
jgi:hypothetical protein